MKLGHFTNRMVLDSEKDFEFEGICGTEEGILWEDSLDVLLNFYGEGY